MKILFNEAMQRTPETSYDLAVRGQRLDCLCLCVDSPKQLTVLQLGIPQTQRGRNSQPGLGLRRKNSLEYEHSRVVSLYQEESGTKNWCTNPLIIMLLHRQEM